MSVASSNPSDVMSVVTEGCSSEPAEVTSISIIVKPAARDVISEHNTVLTHRCTLF